MTAPLRLYDTLARRGLEFEPTGPTVSLYVCGITPYDATHLGHAFTFVSFDVLIRYMRYRGHRVRYIQNITDLDDPLYAKAKQLGVPYDELAASETDQYLADTRSLNIVPADAYPRASGEIPEMVALVEQLLAGGSAYQVDGHVYFSIDSDSHYGELSHLDRESMLELARERGGDPDDPRRRDPLDFLLWRPSKAGEPEVASPWGPGLPGWHLECSAMSLKYLKAPLDIHGGGSDLVFPHHESEIAQSESATGVRPIVRHWMHTGMVFMDGAKMSKSLGNMVFVRHLVPKYGSDAVRLYISSWHYRGELQWDEAELQAAAKVTEEMADILSLPSGADAVAVSTDGFRQRFEAYLDDDLNTPDAIEVLRELATTIRVGNVAGRDVAEAQALLRELGGVLGLQFAR